MNHSKTISLALLGALLMPATTQAQEKKAPPKKKLFRAMTLSSSGGSRKPPTQTELKQRLTKKLAGPWLSNVAWNYDYAKALQESKTNGKPLFAYFTRSYAP